MLCNVCLLALLGVREHRFILRNIGHRQTVLTLIRIRILKFVLWSLEQIIVQRT